MKTVLVHQDYRKKIPPVFAIPMSLVLKLATMKPVFMRIEIRTVFEICFKHLHSIQTKCIEKIPNCDINMLKTTNSSLRNYSQFEN